MEINGYTLVEPPLKGGMALVYKGENGIFHRAFKMVRPDKAANNPKLCARFLKEIHVQAKLDHPNIIKILGAYPFTDNENVTHTVLEMEWLTGLDMQRYVERNAKEGLSPEEIKKIAMQTIDGMEYAHSQGILHLDLKPSNLFLTDSGYVKIIDFGISRVMGENPDLVDGAERLTVVNETGESTFKGTLAYASPEQQVGGKLGFPSDIYSFGKTLHFLSTGTSDPSAEIADEKLREIVDKCIQSNPKHRYQTFGEVRDAFENKGGRECVYCHAVVDGSFKFCPACGKPLPDQNAPKQDICPRCGKPHQAGHRFCIHCGWDFEQDTRVKTITGYHCSRCNNINRAYSDGVMNFCNFCGAPKECLTPIYSNNAPVGGNGQ